MAHSAASFFFLERTCEMAHDRVELRDYDVRHPDAPIHGAAGQGALEWYEYPGGVVHDEAAATRARTRLEQLQRLRVRLEGRSACARLQPGRIVRIEGAADDAFGGELLLVEVEHTLVAPSPNDDGTAAALRQSRRSSSRSTRSERSAPHCREPTRGSTRWRRRS